MMPSLFLQLLFNPGLFIRERTDSLAHLTTTVKRLSFFTMKQSPP